MSTAASSTPSLTPSRAPTPQVPTQPDHFYGSENAQQLPLSPDSDGKTWLDPEDDPSAQRGIPVFKPTVEEFEDFEAYMDRIECWGKKSGIVKVIPPKEWTDALPPLNPQLARVKLQNPIEQHMLGSGGLFRQQNLEKPRVMSVREWSELCEKEELRAPGIDDVGLRARATNGSAKARTRRARKKAGKSETAEPDADTHIKEEENNSQAHLSDGSPQPFASSSCAVVSATPVGDQYSGLSVEHVEPHSTVSVLDSVSVRDTPFRLGEEETEEKPNVKGKRVGQSRDARKASLAQRADKDKKFLEKFDPHSDWLPPNTTPFDYTPEFCKELERRYWRNCGLGRPAWYGADMQGTLFTSETKSWNVAHLESALSRLLPASSQGLPGVNTPYLYFGMWRATFAWHVEDMDLFSINYIHFGAPKFWYAVPQARATALEQTLRGYFPKDSSLCRQFLRHKSFLASPTLLSQSSCRPNCLVQHAGEFVITYPNGYHAGFNLGFNCAESVNFALQSWLKFGQDAQVCSCVSFSVRIDVKKLMHDREAERAQEKTSQPQLKSSKSGRIKNESESSREQPSRKRKVEGSDGSCKTKKQKTKTTKGGPAEASSSKLATKVTLKLGPKPKETEVFPCCLCVSMNQDRVLRVQDPPLWRKEGESVPGADPKTAVWMAHEDCANIVPETWVDEVEIGEVRDDGTRGKERVVFGVDAIVKDRWNLKCSACTKTRHKAHGAPVQCTKGKCPKAFHVSCARDGAASGIVFNVLREVEKEVVIMGAQEMPTTLNPPQMVVDVPAIADGLTMPLDQASLVPEANGLDFSGTPTIGMSVAPVTDSAEPSSSHVYKFVKKVEVQVLCSQHNPKIAQEKKELKQQRIRDDLVALPPMTRIKLRVSAGVFEVSLLRVIEETNSVEVLWDRGLKREFKWGSVVFGNTEGLTVGQKPTEAAPEPVQLAAQLPTLQPRAAFPRFSTATPPVDARNQAVSPLSIPLQPTLSLSVPSPGPSTATAPVYTPPSAPYPPRPNTYQYSSAAWKYNFPPPNATPSYATSGPSTQSYQYASTAYQSAGTYRGHSGYNYTPNQYQSRGLQWQRPYTGPKPNAYGETLTSTLTAQAVPYAPPAQAVPYYPPGQTINDKAPVGSQPQWASTLAMSISNPPPAAPPSSQLPPATVTPDAPS
ncbi:hypothetical protein SCP_0802370 [Sparassis crispa]|uniref:[histone H3]-trimethyl-L-lysine(9) demethylase n=1 Tax=Sparassis crispa TaxID=139825 RepID=A0A401GU03_9APHY|nr:hypothetical protein SCP_0802370 [Sparassis crispa]GBE85715.1 hypothetical protein SCP_0802370 [Sparassis crispa]